MWIDTHTHFDADIFDKTRAMDWEKAQSLGVSAQFMMGIEPTNFDKLQHLSNKYFKTFFALGIHPMHAQSLDFAVAMKKFKQVIDNNINNTSFIGLGEIGLDGFINSVSWDKQVDLLKLQLRLARDYDLPVFLHTNKAQDHVLKYCKEFRIKHGIAHAFSGSEQQANYYLSQGFKLGFGGAFTYTRAKKLRYLAKTLPLETIVLETDCPYMSPYWAYKQTNYSYHLPKIAENLADLRNISLVVLAKQLSKNTELFF